MTPGLSIIAGGARSPAGFVRELVRRQPTLAWLGLLTLAAMIPTAIAAVLDPAPFLGQNAWFKPMRFQASLGLYALTLAWCAGYLTPTARTARALGWIVPTVVATTLFEAIYITLQAGLGEASHYNHGDRLHSVLWALMGIGAVALVFTGFALALEIRRDGKAGLPEAFRHAVVLGLALTFILGALTGGVMAAAGNHYVEHVATEPGLPIVGWSTVAGDWRPPHFFGMHAGQALPAFGTLMVLLGISRGKLAVTVFAFAYSALTIVTLVQAWLDLPFIALGGAG